MNIKIYTDGACSGNPGPGGFGVILSTILPNGTVHESKYCRGFRMTTNNRMELGAVIFSISSLNGSHNIEVISDSKYVCDAFNKKWIYNWQKRGWKKSTGPLPNKDLWIKLWDLISKQQSIKFTWIKGHDKNPYNNECDRLAVAARQDISNLGIDEQYEISIQKWE